MSLQNKTYLTIWGSIFIFILGLTQSHHWINYSVQPSLLGFPTWLWCFMGFHFLLILALIGFAKNSEKE